MALTQVTLTVESATFAVAQGVGQFVSDVAKAVKAGGGTLPEGVAIATAAIADLMPVISDISQLGGDLAQDKAAFLMAWLAAADQLFEKLTASPVVTAPVTA